MMRFGLMAATVAMACAAPASAAEIISVNVADAVYLGGFRYASNGVLFANSTFPTLRENGTISVRNGEIFSANYDPDWEHFTSVTLFGDVGTELLFTNSPQPLRITLQQTGLQTITLGSYTFSNVSGFQVNGNTVRVAAFAISVPEPETWTLLIAGFGAIGVTLRARRSRTRRSLLAAL